ncbi:MAG: sugar ABC transporter substrate-binding protein, partial [Clostridiales bacterium]|nr:sugar ABC transporter substrate-binding protein [Clostridiales bacterium]
DLFARFSEQTGIQVEIEHVVWDQIDAKLVITNTAGAPAADLFWCSSQKLASLVNAGALRGLDDKIAADLNAADFTDLMWSAVTYPGDGKKYMILASVHSRGLWYNTDLMPEAPKTWDELVTMGQAATNPDTNTFGFGFYGYNNYGAIEVGVAPFIWSAGGAIADDTGKATWNTPEAAEAIQFLSDLINVHKIAPESCYTSEFTEIQEAFKAGQIASFVTGTYAVSDLMQSELGMAGKIKFAPIPGKDGPAPNFSNGWSMGIPSMTSDEQADLAWQLIKFMCDPAIQAEHSVIEGGLPTTLASYASEAFQVEPFPSFLDNLPNGRSMDPVLHYQEELQAAIVAVNTYFYDPSQNLQDLLDNSVNEFNAQFGY